MVRLLLRGLAVLLALLGLFGTHSAMWFRLEEEGDLERIQQVDLVLGGMLALAFVLFFAPGQLRPLWAWPL